MKVQGGAVDYSFQTDLQVMPLCDLRVECSKPVVEARNRLLQLLQPGHYRRLVLAEILTSLWSFGFDRMDSVNSTYSSSELGRTWGLDRPSCTPGSRVLPNLEGPW